MDLLINDKLNFNTPLKIGFFLVNTVRQKKFRVFFLDAFQKAKFNKEVKLIIQGATATTEDSNAFEEYIKKYSGNSNIEFWHKNLIGLEWQNALMSVDVIIMPYAAERYRYHWSAMLFTAIGFYKPFFAVTRDESRSFARV